MHASGGARTLLSSALLRCVCRRSSSQPLPSPSRPGLSPASHPSLSKSREIGARWCSSTSLPVAGRKERVAESVFNLVRHIEDITGITAVREAQAAAVEAERDFSRVQDQRRDMQADIRQVQSRLKDIHSELDKTSRGEDRYLKLLTEEHGIIKKEKACMEEFKALELTERDKFNELSARLRESHEKERERAERTKYWSIIGTVIGALLGIAGSAISNRMRMSRFQELVETQTDPSRVNAVLGDLTAMVTGQQEAVRVFVGDLRGILAKEGEIGVSAAAAAPSGAGGDSGEVLAAIRESGGRLESELSEVRRLVAAELGYAARADGSIVYVGPELKTLLDETEANLEWKMKIAALANVVALYAALVITLPLIAGWFAPAN